MEMCRQGKGSRLGLSLLSPVAAMLTCWCCPAATFCHIQGRSGQEKNLSCILWRLCLLAVSFGLSGSTVVPPAPGFVSSVLC